MNVHKFYLTENACYKAGRKITPKGIMVHSTGANNPYLRRYIGPDDGKLGPNTYGNHWNQDKPGGKQKCVHAFIGKLRDGSIATYQTLPWNHRGWHAGGSANDTHIGFEICEDDLTDAVYFGKVYQEAVELCAYLCKRYGLTEKDILCHSEGRKKGIASNHADVMHWFPKHGKSMDTFRADVKALLSEPAKPSKTVDELAREVLAGKWGNGSDRKNRLTAAGYDYAAVQARVNALCAAAKSEPWTPKVGDIVNYTGKVHYSNANAAKGMTCKSGKAKITAIYRLGKSKHPYHLVKVSGAGSTVYGWVNEGTFTKA